MEIDLNGRKICVCTKHMIDNIKSNVATDLFPGPVPSLSIKFNIARHYTNEIIDVDTRSDDNRVFREPRACVGSLVEAGYVVRDDSPVKGFPLSNNTVLLHGNVPLLYFAA